MRRAGRLRTEQAFAVVLRKWYKLSDAQDALHCAEAALSKAEAEQHFREEAEHDAKVRAENAMLRAENADLRAQLAHYQLLEEIRARARGEVESMMSEYESEYEDQCHGS